MLGKILLWLLAIVITLAAAIYQRKTGPTYPLEGSSQIAETKVSYSLGRSHGGEGDQPVIITAPDTTVTGTLTYRRYPTNDEWTEVEMIREGQNLQAYLPHQPPAGKLEYYINLQKAGTTLTIPANESVVHDLEVLYRSL